MQLSQDMLNAYQKLAVNQTMSGVKVQADTLPIGWKREEILRRNGLNSGKSIVFYVSPSGEKIKTPKEMQAILGKKYDVTLFDWRSGKFSNSLKHKNCVTNIDGSSTKKLRSDDTWSGYKRRNLPSSLPKPTIIRGHTDSIRQEKPSTQECLKQLFNERRLADKKAVDYRNGHALSLTSMPKGIQSAGIPGYDKIQLLQNIMATLASRSGPITGQDQPISAIEKNPCALINHKQPYIKSFVVTDDDIQKQQLRVKKLRRKLESARKRYGSPPQSDREG